MQPLPVSCPHESVAALISVSAVEIVERARQLAGNLLFPTALETDRLLAPPRSHLDAFADAGLYGLTSPTAVGGLGVDPATTFATIEALAGGCLSTTFVWLQHLNTARTIAALGLPTATALAAGTLRSGIAFAHLRRPGLPMLQARRVGAQWRLDGDAPWVSGWGCIDVVHVASINADAPDAIVWTLLDARESSTLGMSRLALAAMNATSTVELHARGHLVHDDRVTLIEPLATWLDRDAMGLRSNGSLALGLTSRCVTLLDEPGSLGNRLAAARTALDAADNPDATANARANACLLAVDAATALVVRGGGGALKIDAHAQRLAREAMFLLVQGQTTEIRAQQLLRLTGKRH